MKKVVILASEHCLFSSVGGPMNILMQAGVLWNGILGKTTSPLFDAKGTLPFLQYFLLMADA
jgi:hypothetical protein